MSPLLLLGDSIDYLTREHYCFVSLVHLWSAMWYAFVTYGLPILCLLIIYIRITIFLCRQPSTQRTLIQRRRSRDFDAIRCIFMTVALLLTGGFPGVIFTAMFFSTGEEHRLMHRISVFSLMISLTALSVGLVFFSPELKGIFTRRRTKTPLSPFQRIDPNQFPMEPIIIPS